MKKYYWLVFPLLVLLIGIWVSTGTLTPYANTLPDDGDLLLVSDTPCVYLYNIDHPLHIAAFYMLDGVDKESDVLKPELLRRILFPLLAYPLMKLFSYEVGGVIAGTLLNLIALVVFAFFIRKKYGVFSSYIAVWILALYPGITYWAGLPYSYTCIVPFTLFCTILLFKIHETSNKIHCLFYAFLMGVLFNGYDLIVYFLPATLIVLFVKKEFKIMPLCVLMFILPSVITNYLLYVLYHIPLNNANSAVYSIILNAYFDMFRNINNFDWFKDWFNNIFFVRNIGVTFVHVFLKSNFYALPVLFLFIYGYARIRLKLKFNTVEMSLVAITILLFLFNNLAPEYDGFQMRGAKMARLSQPIFVVYVMYISRFFYLYKNKLQNIRVFIAAVVITIVFNALVVFGPITKNPLAEVVYLKFYEHTYGREMIKNLDKYGRRPLGICN